MANGKYGITLARKFSISIGVGQKTAKKDRVNKGLWLPKFFGLRMSNPHRMAIKALLSGVEWKHVTYYRILPNSDGFGLCRVNDGY